LYELVKTNEGAPTGSGVSHAGVDENNLNIQWEELKGRKYLVDLEVKVI
jgi:hypothetical protein